MENELFYNTHLEDGEYYARVDLGKNKVLFIRCDGEKYYFTSECIYISLFLQGIMLPNLYENIVMNGGCTSNNLICQLSKMEEKHR